MKKQQVHNRKYLEERRKGLRKNLTPAESSLWTYLQNKKFEGRKFRRQHSIKNYIVDFYCAKEKLIIELDGEIHNNPWTQEKDTKRTEELEALGFKVIRLENKMVFDFLPSVLREIRNSFGAQEPFRPR